MAITMQRVGSFVRHHWPVLLAVLLLIISLLLPRFELPRQTWHFVVTFDISQSMNVADVAIDDQPVTRIEMARRAAARMLGEMPCGSTIGWSIFTEHRSFPLLMPLEVCENYEALLTTLERIDDRMRWRDSSQIGKGVYWSIRNARNAALDFKTHVAFLTDGHEAPPQRPGTQLMPDIGEKAGGWIFGVGSQAASRIPRSDDTGKITGYWSAEDVVQSGSRAEHLSALREDHLRALSDFSGLGYQTLGDVDDLARVMTDAALATEQPAQTSVSWMPALLALLLLCWQFVPRGAMMKPSRA